MLSFVIEERRDSHDSPVWLWSALLGGEEVMTCEFTMLEKALVQC